MDERGKRGEEERTWMKGERENVDERRKRGEEERTWMKGEREGRKREHG